MDLTLLHPKIVHLPIALAVLMPLLTTGLLLAWWRDWLPGRTWWVAVAFQVVLVVSGFAAMQTGEIDEEPVERVVAETHIEAHEEAAERFVWLSVGVLLLFGAAGVPRNRKLAIGLATAALVGSWIVLAAGYQTGQAGGDLVYKHGAAAAFANQDAGAAHIAKGRDHDDDD